MRTLKTEGIIIKRRNVGEADRFVTIFTRDMGKITVKAKGVRKIVSRRSSHIELLNHASLSLYKGQYYPTLLEVQTLQDFSYIKSDLEKVGFAYHFCELIDGLCPENEENQEIFNLLLKSFTNFEQVSNLAVFIHDFEVSLLSLLGFWHQGRVSDTKYVIEGILERRLRAQNIFSKLI